MAKENAAQTALATVRERVEQYGSRLSSDTLVAFADAEVRAEQAKQQEIANLIAMLATPAACPFPSQDVLARIKELVNL